MTGVQTCALPIFMIDGGAGRVIASIPALEKYVKSHPNEDIKILIGGWDNLLWGNILLQNITYSMDTKGVFENVVKEIANLVANHIPENDTKLVAEEDGLQQIYALYVDDKKLVDFTIEGWKYYFKPERRKVTGSWDSFLEGSIEAIAEFSFLREIKKLGYKTTDPR